MATLAIKIPNTFTTQSLQSVRPDPVRPDPIFTCRGLKTTPTPIHSNNTQRIKTALEPKKVKSQTTHHILQTIGSPTIQETNEILRWATKTTPYPKATKAFLGEKDHGTLHRTLHTWNERQWQPGFKKNETQGTSYCEIEKWTSNTTPYSKQCISLGFKHHSVLTQV